MAFDDKLFNLPLRVHSLHQLFNIRCGRLLIQCVLKKPDASAAGFVVLIVPLLFAAAVGVVPSDFILNEAPSTKPMAKIAIA